MHYEINNNNNNNEREKLYLVVQATTTRNAQTKLKITRKYITTKCCKTNFCFGGFSDTNSI